MQQGQKKKARLQKPVPGRLCRTHTHWSDGSPNFLQPQNGDMKIIMGKREYCILCFEPGPKVARGNHC